MDAQEQGLWLLFVVAVLWLMFGGGLRKQQLHEGLCGHSRTGLMGIKKERLVAPFLPRERESLSCFSASAV
jgi:hypothetical protein